jgi:hypothetical protein
MPPGYDNSVFVNCPFDSAYRPLFEAVVFAVYDCGFYPRCALEADDSSQVRIQKITKIIGECRLAIHDISRTQLDRESGLPRFNMPPRLSDSLTPLGPDGLFGLLPRVRSCRAAFRSQGHISATDLTRTRPATPWDSPCTSWIQSPSTASGAWQPLR